MAKKEKDVEKMELGTKIYKLTIMNESLSKENIFLKQNLKKYMYFSEFSDSILFKMIMWIFKKIYNINFLLCRVARKIWRKIIANNYKNNHNNTKYFTRYERRLLNKIDKINKKLKKSESLIKNITLYKDEEIKNGKTKY